MQLENIRKSYNLNALTRSDLTDTPIDLFEKWVKEAVTEDVIEPNAFNLSTIRKDGFPSSRIVLLKGIKNNKLLFYTNYNSNKGTEIAHNNKVSVVFFWPQLQRQIRIIGTVQKTSSEQSDDYFHSRPIGSQIGANISPQSQVIEHRSILEKAYKELEASKLPMKRPSYWGGYEITPLTFEFWQGRTSRLHDRFIYEQVNNEWQINRLAP